MKNKMSKKCQPIIVLLLLLICSSVVFAETTPLNNKANSEGSFKFLASNDDSDKNDKFDFSKIAQYYSTHHPKPKLHGAAAQHPYPPATDIVVSNNSADIIFVIVPFSPINDVVYPGTIDHIYNDTLYGDTHLILQDPRRIIFFDDFICRRGYVAVYGGINAYNVQVRC